MYKIRSIEIEGFWHRHDVKATFKDDVNVVIGRNGTGKTTFMNILQAVLAVDVDGLLDVQFDTAVIVLENSDGQRRTIRAAKIEDGKRPYPVIDYKVSTRRFAFPLISEAVSRIYGRRRISEEAGELRSALREIVSLASLSVYRIRVDADVDSRDRIQNKRFASPVDFRLTELMAQFTQYQLELSQQAQEISVDLQKQVLSSLLFEKEARGLIPTTFDAGVEKKNLSLAFTQLGLTGTHITKRIVEHVSSIETAYKELSEKGTTPNIWPLDAKRRTDKVVQLSLKAAEKTKEINSQIDLFLGELTSFISDKKFSLVSGELKIEADGGELPVEKLSSGEKQLLILLIEALLQRQQPFVFLADEPELSLHIAWQRKIVPAVTRINPNAQVIVATHSPEVAGRYTDSLIDMEDMLHGSA
jgi:ABC-type lipoprotein export system ATPase subunit